MTHFCNESLRGTNCCSPYDAIIAMINNAQATADAALALAGNVSSNLGTLMVTIADAIQRLDNLGSVMTYKGSVATYADLPATGNEIGDTWNVIDTGQNYSWTGSTWDQLGTVIDLSNYYTKAQADLQFVPITPAGQSWGPGITKLYANREGTIDTVWFTAGSVGNSIAIRRSTTKNFDVDTPQTDNECATKKYVDDGLATKFTARTSGGNCVYGFYAQQQYYYEATYGPSANTIVIRDTPGNCVRTGDPDSYEDAAIPKSWGNSHYQSILIDSGVNQNIKTINGQSILGTGNIAANTATYTAITELQLTWSYVSQLTVGTRFLVNIGRAHEGHYDHDIRMYGGMLTLTDKSASSVTFMGTFNAFAEDPDSGTYVDKIFSRLVINEPSGGIPVNRFYVYTMGQLTDSQLTPTEWNIYITGYRLE